MDEGWGVLVKNYMKGRDECQSDLQERVHHFGLLRFRRFHRGFRHLRTAKIPAVGVTCTNPQITEGNDHYFRICFLDPFQGTVLANFAKDELKAEKVYCLGQLGNDYDQGLMNYFKQAAEKLGMECVVESFPKNNSDFTSYLTTAKNEGADVIFAPPPSAMHS